MSKKGQALAKNIVFSLIPACLTYLSKSDSVLDYLHNKQYIGSNIDIVLIKDKALILSIILTFALLTYNLIKYDLDKINYRKQRDKLLEFNKNIFVNALATELNNDYLHIDMRIFVPKLTLYLRISRIFNKKIEFVIRNLDSLADVGMTNGLKLEVYPNPQGLVGECYTTKYMVYDIDLKNTNSTKYRLKKDQLNKTNDLRFCLCCPIFNSKEEIIAIVAFDSKHAIHIEDSYKEKLRNSIIVFTQSLYEYIPEIFKPKGGIL